jgi:hypothetical protein
MDQLKALDQPQGCQQELQKRRQLTKEQVMKLSLGGGSKGTKN